MKRVLMAAAVVVLALAPTVPSGATSNVTVTATIGGRRAAASSDRHPVPLSARPTEIDIRLTNNSASPIEARTVQLSGTVIGLTFFSYETSIRIAVEPGATTELRFTLDLAALGGQVTGLIPARLSVLDARRHRLASQRLTVKIHGSAKSVYAVFELLLLLLTALAVAELLLALARQRLPANRWTRGFRFLLPGVGVGIVLSIGASLLGVLAPTSTRSVPIILIAAAAMFVAGYLTPAQEGDEGESGTGEDDGPARSPAATTLRPGSTPGS